MFLGEKIMTILAHETLQSTFPDAEASFTYIEERMAKSKLGRAESYVRALSKIKKIENHAPNIAWTHLHWNQLPWICVLARLKLQRWQIVSLRVDLPCCNKKVFVPYRLHYTSLEPEWESVSEILVLWSYFVFWIIWNEWTWIDARPSWKQPQNYICCRQFSSA